MNVKQKIQLVVASLLLLVGMQTHAASITHSSILTVYYPNGNIYKQVSAGWDDLINYNGLFSIPDADLTNYPANPPTTQVVDPITGKVRSLFGVGDFSDPSISNLCNDHNHFCLAFISAPPGVNLGFDPSLLTVKEDTLGPIVPHCPIVQGNYSLNCWNATIYLNSTLLGYTATFSFEDIPVAIHIPEPISMALVGLGSLMMSFARRTSYKRS